MTEPRIAEVGYWEELAGMDEDARQSEMLARFEELIGMSAEERAESLQSMSRAAYQLSDEKLEVLTRSRLLTWVDWDREKAKTVAQAFDQSMNSLPAQIAMRRVTVSQTVALKFSPDQNAALAEIVPRIFAAMPGAGAEQASPSAAASETASAEPKPWWKFW